jgi:hypothetical protein
VASISKNAKGFCNFNSTIYFFCKGKSLNSKRRHSLKS